MEIQIRASRAGDLERLIEMDRAAQQEADRAALIRAAAGGSRCWVAEVDGGVAGFLITTDHFFGQEFIELVYVAVEHRRIGVGNALIAFAEASCPREKLFTSTNRSNRSMQLLLERRGWLLSGNIDNLDEGDPELVYVRMRTRDE